MVKFCVIYQGRPENPEEFDQHYWNGHLPIIARWPKIRRITLTRCRQLNEECYMIAEFSFDTLADLEAALASPERKEAGRDRLNFPKFYGTIRHQIFDVRDYPVPGGVA
ncbi:MAG: EthD family reductase [Candidatus Binatia bacterium]